MDETTGRPDGSDRTGAAVPPGAELIGAALPEHASDPAMAALEQIPHRLAALAEQDLTEHPAAYDALHRDLTAALDGIDRPAGTPAGVATSRPVPEPAADPAQRPLPGVPGPAADRA